MDDGVKGSPLFLADYNRNKIYRKRSRLYNSSGFYGTGIGIYQPRDSFSLIK